MTIYGDSRSGNCLKVRMLCDLLDFHYAWREVDIMAGETQTQAFLVKNPNGKIPVIELDDGRTLSESNAILCYLGQHTRYWPQDAWQQAKMHQWLSFEQYSHEPNVAVARFIKLYQGLPDERLAEYRQKVESGHKALAVMERALTDQSFLVGERMSLADISLYAYTSRAHEAGIELGNYPNLVAWIMRVSEHLIQSKHRQGVA
ncbi:glutathione S-transferase family protein [Paraferrimonas sedimenticola]|uniref:glutathione S-transferase family protein n=1 Tax=Paraferrimonas sedimenticola TaxID=375674 RepID=UPI000BA9AE7F|nr:glutathione S-transferase family protein [Paraferrimonas sedimenticola]